MKSEDLILLIWAVSNIVSQSVLITELYPTPPHFKLICPSQSTRRFKIPLIWDISIWIKQKQSFAQAQNCTVLLCITWTCTICHITPLDYLHMLSMAQHCSVLLEYTQYGTVQLYVTFTCRTQHSIHLHYLYTHYMAQYCTVLLVYTQYGTVQLCTTCIYTIWHSTALHYF